VRTKLLFDEWRDGDYRGMRSGDAGRIVKVYG
jgi:hypothetical protein